jgi:CheY-like chemotaxis protein
MTASKSILTISRDQPLQSTRTFILEQAGYSVSAALNDNDAVAFVAEPNTLSLVLMCHSVSRSEPGLAGKQDQGAQPKPSDPDVVQRI